MVWQIPDAVDTVVYAPDVGWKYQRKRVEQFPDINKLCNVATCWIYSGIPLGAHPILHISGIRVNRMLRNFRLQPRYKWEFRSSEKRGTWFICLLCSSSPYSLYFPLVFYIFSFTFSFFSPLRLHFLHLEMASCSGPDFPQSTPEAIRLSSCPSRPSNADINTS
jgi:hypothetical protein